MPTFWKNTNGKIIVNASNEPVDCADCPCNVCGDCDGVALPATMTATFVFGACGCDDVIATVSYLTTVSGICYWRGEFFSYDCESCGADPGLGVPAYQVFDIVYNTALNEWRIIWGAGTNLCFSNPGPRIWGFTGTQLTGTCSPLLLEGPINPGSADCDITVYVTP